MEKDPAPLISIGSPAIENVATTSAYSILGSNAEGYLQCGECLVYWVDGKRLFPRGARQN